jgi:hypothetical protein
MFWDAIASNHLSRHFAVRPETSFRKLLSLRANFCRADAAATKQFHRQEAAHRHCPLSAAISNVLLSSASWRLGVLAIISSSPAIGNRVYFTTKTELVNPLSSSSVSGLAGSRIQSPSMMNLYVYLPVAKSMRHTHSSPSLPQSTCD